MSSSLNKKRLKRIIWTLTALFAVMNIVAIFHAYKFTHFARNEMAKTKDPTILSAKQKFMTLAFGINNPRPTNRNFPTRKYETINLKSNKTIECWYIPQEQSKGTVIIYHGFSGNKSSMLDKAEEFLNLNYNVLLVDFMGSGGSEGSQTTIGYFEAEQVRSSFEYVLNKGEPNIYLFGTSMGSVAIMKAINDFDLKPRGIILECPFGSMYKTVCARFRLMHAPAFPMAALLVFWGGLQNGFWAFGHNPTEYAKKISCPTLIIYGGQDKKVSSAEIDEIYANLKGTKQLKVYELAGHENLLNKYPADWRQDVKTFMHAN
jgi:alpha-beta hydrolase superfamily lysophospholipase